MIWTDLNVLIISRTSSALTLGGRAIAAAGVLRPIRRTAEHPFVPWTDQMMFHESTERDQLAYRCKLLSSYCSVLLFSRKIKDLSES